MHRTLNLPWLRWIALTAGIALLLVAFGPPGSVARAEHDADVHHEGATDHDDGHILGDGHGGITSHDDDHIAGDDHEGATAHDDDHMMTLAGHDGAATMTTTSWAMGTPVARPMTTPISWATGTPAQAPTTAPMW